MDVTQLFILQHSVTIFKPSKKNVFTLFYGYNLCFDFSVVFVLLCILINDQFNYSIKI